MVKGSRFFLCLLLAILLQAFLLAVSLYEAEWQQAWAAWNWPAVLVAMVLAAGLWLTSEAPPEPLVSDPVPRLGWYLAAILALAIALRVYAIDRMPPGFFQDEAINGLDALKLGDEYRWRFWSESISGRPTLFLYLLLLPLRLFEPSYLSLKVLPVALGVATVGAVFVLARVAFGDRVALWAAFLLAASRWHIHYSRMAWEAICVPLIATAAFTLLLRSRRSEEPMPWAVAAGATLAIGLYTYAGYRVVPLIALILLISWLWTSVGAPSRRTAPARAAVVAGAAVFLLVSTPLLLFAWQNPEFFWERYREVSLSKQTIGHGYRVYADQLGKSILSFNHRGDALVRHNLPLAPQLDPVTGVLFLLGAVLALRQLGREPIPLLWLWWLGFVALCAVTTEAPHATRLLGAAPAVMILAGLGVDGIWRRVRELSRSALSLGVSVIAIAIVALNAHAYFVRHAEDRTIDQGFNTLARELCDRAASQPGSTLFWTQDIEYWARPQCQFLARNVHIALFPLTTEQLLAGPPATDPPMIIAVGLTAIRDSAGRIAMGADELPRLPFPSKPELVRDRNGLKLYYLYRIE